MGNLLQAAVLDRDLHSEALLRTRGTRIEPLPPSQFHAHQDRVPYEPSLPALQRTTLTDQHHIAHARWLATTVHSLAAATAALAQAVCIQSAPQLREHADEEQLANVSRVIPSPAEPAAIDAHPEASWADAANEAEHMPVGNLEVATCADHLRHVARIAQQLTAALSVHLDLCSEDLRAKRPGTSPAIVVDPSQKAEHEHAEKPETHSDAPHPDRADLHAQGSTEEEC